MAAEGTHDSLSKEEVAEEGGDHEVLAEEALEGAEGEDIVRNGLCDRRENPSEFAQRRVPLVGVPCDPLEDVSRILSQRRVFAEP